MVEYICNKCNTEFKQKIDYTRHINKKYPCVTQEELKNSKFTEDESLKKLESFFSKIRDILRDCESITGHKALDVITDFLLLRLLNIAMDNKQSNMNFATKKYDKSVKLEGTQIEYDIDEYKKYFKWNELMDLIKDIDSTSDNGKKELLNHIVINVIFSGIFKFHEQTKEIFKNKKFLVQKTTTIIKLLKEFNKIDFNDFDVDVKGKAYELTIQKEGASNKEFGQYFTPRWVDKYLVEKTNIEIDKDGNYTKCMDPACGTAGILTEYLSKVQKIADDKDVILNKDVDKFIYGFEIVDDTLKIAHMNILLKSGSYDKNIKCKDFLESGCFDFDKDKFDGNIATNPPFALTKNYDDIFKNKEMYPIKTKSGTLLFLQSCIGILKKGRSCVMVSPNGKEIFGKNKEFVDLRKHVMTSCNLQKIAMLPSGSFKPYTGVETLVLIMIKGEKTKEVQFVNVTKNKDDTTTETKLCKIKYEDFEKHGFSWNYKDYIGDKVQKYGDIEYMKIDTICDIKSGKYNSNDMDNIGKIPFYSCSANNPVGFHSKYSFDYDEYILLIAGGGSINNKEGDNVGLGKVYYINGQTACRANVICLKIKNIDISTKYLFLYLKTNKKVISNIAHFTTNLGTISIDNIKSIEIPVPPLQIQDLIVKELDSMYKDKENVQNSINERNTSRKAMFEMLLNDCKDKKEVKLDDICGFNMNNIKDFNKSEYMYIDISSVKKGILVEEKIIEKDELPSRAKREGLINDILISSVRPNLENYLYLTDQHIKSNTVISTGFIIITTDKKKADPRFIYQYVTSDNITQKLVSLTSGANYPSITADDIKKISVQLPTKQDQERIIKEMEQFDELDRLQKAHLTRLETLIKQRFEYHLSKCKKNDKKQEEDNDSENENEEDDSDKKKGNKKNVQSDSDNESEQEVKPKKKSNKKNVQSDSEEEVVKKKSNKKNVQSDSEEEVVKKKSNKKAVQSDSEEEVVKKKSNKKTVQSDSDNESDQSEEKINGKLYKVGKLVKKNK
jgi:type I restriction-modification system DNA methylase subunit/restriction endonuclease S subunit